jgi:hypothetical protein
MQTPGGTLLSPTPLVTAVTPSRSRAAAEEAPQVPSSGQHIRVVLRIKPPALDLDAGAPCIIAVGADSLSIAAPLREDAEGAADTGARTPSRPTTPCRSRPTTPGRAGAPPPNRWERDRTPAGARTPSRAGDGDKSGPAPPRQFTYDAVAGPGEPQSAVFDQARPLVLSALAGGNACVLAYGQTGSGEHKIISGNAGQAQADCTEKQRGMGRGLPIKGEDWELNRQGPRKRSPLHPFLQVPPSTPPPSPLSQARRIPWSASRARPA